MAILPMLTRQALDAYTYLSLPVWVFSVDTLEIRFANSAAQDWLGYDAETLMSMTIADLRPEQDRSRIFYRVRHFDGHTGDAGTWTIVGATGAQFTVSFTWRKVTFDGSGAIVASIRDVTPIAQAKAKVETLSQQNEALHRQARLSNEHLSRLFDAVPGKMLVLSPGDYRIVAVTDEYAQAVMQEREALVGRRLFEVFPDDPSEPQADGVRNLRASLRRVEQFQATDVMNLQRYPVRGPDGAFQERFWLPHNKPVLDAAGDIIYIVHRVEDVSGVLATAGTQADPTSDAQRSGSQESLETGLALLALRERETRLQTAEKLLGLGAWEYDFERGALNWSDRAFEIYGVPLHRGSPNVADYIALVHPEDRAQMVTNYTRFLEGAAPEIEFQHRVIKDDGSISHVRGVGARHIADGKEVVIGVVQDITAVKQTEEALLVQARRRRLAGRLSKLGSWRVDLAGTHVTWCEQTAAIHDEPEGTSPTIDEGINYYIPEHRDLIRARFEACAKEGLAFDEVLQIETAKGRRVWVHTLGEPIRDDSGKIVAVEGAFQDITDLVSARDQASLLSSRLIRTLNSMSDAFLLMDENWNFSFVNSKAEDLLQQPKEQLLGQNAWEIFPEAKGESFQRRYERAVTEGRSVRFQEYFAPLETWFEVSADPTPDGLAVYFRDITQDRARDLQLRLLETAVARQTDILLITEAEPIDGPEGPRIVYVNEAFERITGYSRDEVIGNTPRFLQGPKTQRSELDRIRRALEKGQPVRAELINYTKAGEEFWLELDIVPLADDAGLFTHFVAIERDITQRKRAQNRLAASEERFRLVAKASGRAIWDWNVATDEQWWSEGLGDIFGHESTSSSSASDGWRSHVHPEDLTRVDEAFQRLKSGADSSLRQRYRFRRGDGTWALVEDNAFAILDVDGSVQRILGSMTDITEQQQLEERLHQSQKLETVGQLTGGVAHDFNNLLTVILGNTELLEDALEDRPRLQKIAKVTADAAERGAELTDRLLAFSRKQALSPKVLNVADLILSTRDLLLRTLPANIDVEIVLADSLWSIEADVSQVESALLNLALNARDAMPGGGHLTIEVENVTIDEDYDATDPDFDQGQYVVIAFTDSGQGIPPDVMNQIFEPFFTTKGVGKGSGLGLSMVFGFVKQSGGHIRVYSEVDEGTSFKLYFPRCVTKDAQVRAPDMEQSFPGGTETILVVEDEPAVRDYVSLQLEALGYTVLTASNGAEALEVLHRGRVDLLFTDMVMPGEMDGRQLADAAHELHPELKILFTSGYTEHAVIHNGRLERGVNLLSKPYRREQLAEKIRNILDKDGTPSAH